MMVSLNAMLHADVFVAGSVVAVVTGVSFCVNTSVGPTVLPCQVSAPLVVPTKTVMPAALAGNIAGGEIISEPVLVS